MAGVSSDKSIQIHKFGANTATAAVAAENNTKGASSQHAAEDAGSIEAAPAPADARHAHALADMAAVSHRGANVCKPWSKFT